MPQSWYRLQTLLQRAALGQGSIQYVCYKMNVVNSNIGGKYASCIILVLRNCLALQNTLSRSQIFISNALYIGNLIFSTHAGNGISQLSQDFRQPLDCSHFCLYQSATVLQFPYLSFYFHYILITYIYNIYLHFKNCFHIFPFQ